MPNRSHYVGNFDKLYTLLRHQMILILRLGDSVIGQIRYIKIQPNTIDLSTRLWGINPTNSVFIPQSLVLWFIV